MREHLFVIYDFAYKLVFYHLYENTFREINDLVERHLRALSRLLNLVHDLNFLVVSDLRIVEPLGLDAFDFTDEYRVDDAHVLLRRVLSDLVHQKHLRELGNLVDVRGYLLVLAELMRDHIEVEVIKFSLLYHI